MTDKLLEPSYSETPDPADHVSRKAVSRENKPQHRVQGNRTVFLTGQEAGI